MHIEPGFITPAKVLLANATAAGVVAYYVKAVLKKPFEIVKILLAAFFFSVFMQIFHLNVGPSELHFIGGMAIYMTLGFIPTLLGFALGLFLQGVLFEPVDLPHLAVNSLSLIMPLITVHYTVGKKFFENASKNVLTWKTILKFDAIFYSGVTTMVGFWLLLGETATPFAAWLAFASSYLAVVAIEPFVTYSAIWLLKRYETNSAVEKCFSVKNLKLTA